VEGNHDLVLGDDPFFLHSEFASPSPRHGRDLRGSPVHGSRGWWGEGRGGAKSCSCLNINSELLAGNAQLYSCPCPYGN
jgi:hypothetical protein